jgi:prevent-host-death family protein
MKSVHAHEAKTHLTQLLDRVARGEEIQITRNGRPVARLVPEPGQQETDLRSVIAGPLVVPPFVAWAVDARCDRFAYRSAGTRNACASLVSILRKRSVTVGIDAE